MADNDQGSERRHRSRARSLLSGRLFLADKGSTADCVVRNLSDEGARVRVSAAIRVTQEVGLLMIRDGVYFDAELAWRSGDEAGLTFKARHDLSGEIPSRLALAKLLWRTMTVR